METNQPIETLVRQAIELEGHKIPDTVELADETLKSGWFDKITKELDLPWRFIARAMDVHPPALRKWIRGEIKPNRISSLKISLFRVCVDDLIATTPVDFWSTALPVKAMAMVRGIPADHLAGNCQTGLLDCHDLGILGLWVTATPKELEANARSRAIQISREK